MLNIRELLSAYSVVPRGVIHVGAHEGGEMATYREIGFTKVLFIEANPEVFSRLKRNVGGEPGVVLANVAISDRTGMAQFNVTSMDQSSSLLPLKAHREFYPTITVTKSLAVQTSTLDELIESLGLNSADFNYLHLDIQGAELMALRGAETTLCSIEAINTEVNLAELYEGCALMKDLEEHVGVRGFNRVALARPYHPSWGDAFYVRRPLITMRTLGSNGRFANQMFQYLFLRLVARRQGFVVQTPPWAGRRVFGLADDQDVMRELPELSEQAIDAPEHLFDGTSILRSEVNFLGFFQLHTSHFAPHREFVRSLFAFAPQFRTALDRVVNALRRRASTLVAVHLRRGDYGYNQFFRAPATWYSDWLSSKSDLGPAPVVYVCSEDAAGLKKHFSAWQAVCAADIPELPPDLAFLLDFYILTRADLVAISNSSYSLMAAMLNCEAREFVRPSLDDRGLAPFDPWNAPVLFSRKVRPEEQAELDAIDAAVTIPA